MDDHYIKQMIYCNASQHARSSLVLIIMGVLNTLVVSLYTIHLNSGELDDLNFKNPL